MKIRVLLLILCWSFSTKAQWANPSTDKPVHDILPRYSSNRIANGTSTRAPYNVTYYRLGFEIDPAVKYIKGKVTVIFKTEQVNFAAVLLDLYSGLTVDSVHYHNGAATFQQNKDNTLHIDLPQALSMGILDSVTVFYQGIPGNSGFGSFIQSTHNGIPIVWTLSEPYGASDWWPCKKELKDKADSIDIYITTPQQYRAAANGLLVDSLLQGNSKIYHWKHRYPIAHYLIGLAITNYVSYYEKVPVLNADTIKVLNYVYPEYYAEARTLSPYIVQVMTLYNNLFDTYPFSKEKYGHAQFGWGGGMEHQTMTFVTNFSADLIAHELGHHWFGDKVTCGTWRDIWLNEGFATYLTGITREKLSPSTWNDWRENALKTATTNDCGSVYVDDTTSVQRIFSGALSYNKGALVLHMLRWQLGDSVFFKGLRQYLTDSALAYNTATTSNLQWHLENASGKNLQSFFDKWVFGQGYPSYTLLWEQNKDKSVAITLKQATSCPSSVTFFDMPVEITISGNGHDTILVINHTQNNQQFSIPLRFSATNISLDPHKWILSTNNIIANTSVTINNDFDVTIQPNPAKENTQVTVTKPIAVNTLEISNIFGQIIYMVSKPFSIDNPTLTLDFTAQPKGLYFIRLRTTSGVVVKKLLVE